MIQIGDKLAVNMGIGAVSHIRGEADNLRTKIFFTSGHSISVWEPFDEVLDKLDPKVPYDQLSEILSSSAMKRAFGEPEK